MEEYLAKVERALTSHLSPVKLKRLSTQLQSELRCRLESSEESCLPSYHHTLPTGQETGTFLALDVGGSNFRLALVSLHTRSQPTENEQTRVLNSLTFSIDEKVRALRGKAFFQWMADRIQEMLTSLPSVTSQFTTSSPLQMGMAWSFPIHATSQRSGYLLDMGKGFCAMTGVQGQDLCSLLMEPCHALSLPVHLATVLNDGSASLLSQAYRQATTRISLILGTGTNSSIYLPVSALSPDKLGGRPRSWLVKARRVCVNTELSMHGADIWPRTRWDERLNAAHDRPGYQPFEHFVGGRYLGEIARLILLEAVSEVGLFDGKVPEGLRGPYSLDSGVLAVFAAAAASDDSSCGPPMTRSDASLDRAAELFTASFRVRPPMTRTEAAFVRDVAALIAERAAAYEAAAVHALWELRGDSEGRLKREEMAMGNGASGRMNGACVGEEKEMKEKEDNEKEEKEKEKRGKEEKNEKEKKKKKKKELKKENNTAADPVGSGMRLLTPRELKVTIACNGSVLEKYPGFRHRCQVYIDALTDLSVTQLGLEGVGAAGDGARLVELSMARESSIFGAAVAAACCLDGEEG